jgi:hypothetical protein
MTIRIVIGWCLAAAYVIVGIWGILFPNSLLSPMADHVILEWIARGLGLFFVYVGLQAFPAYCNELVANSKRLGTKNPFEVWIALFGMAGACIAFTSHQNDPM